MCNQADRGVNWTRAGANSLLTGRESTVLGTMSSSSTGVKTFTLHAIGIARVQSWINSPAMNNGIVIMDYTNNSVGFDISSSETFTVANRPRITITHQ